MTSVPFHRSGDGSKGHGVMFLAVEPTQLLHLLHIHPWIYRLPAGISNICLIFKYWSDAKRACWRFVQWLEALLRPEMENLKEKSSSPFVHNNTPMRRALINYMNRDGWRISFVAEDARTSIGRRFNVKDEESLLRIVTKLRGNEDSVRRHILRWGRGSEWVELSDEQCRFFGIR